MRQIQYPAWTNSVSLTPPTTDALGWRGSRPDAVQYGRVAMGHLVARCGGLMPQGGWIEQATAPQTYGWRGARPETVEHARTRTGNQAAQRSAQDWAASTFVAPAAGVTWGWSGTAPETPRPLGRPQPVPMGVTAPAAPVVTLGWTVSRPEPRTFIAARRPQPALDTTAATFASSFSTAWGWTIRLPETPQTFRVRPRPIPGIDTVAATLVANLSTSLRWSVVLPENPRQFIVRPSPRQDTFASFLPTLPRQFVYVTYPDRLLRAWRQQPDSYIWDRTDIILPPSTTITGTIAVTAFAARCALVGQVGTGTASSGASSRLRRLTATGEKIPIPGRSSPDVQQSIRAIRRRLERLE